MLPRKQAKGNKSGQGEMIVAAIGITILVISVVGAVLWARQSTPDQPRMLFFLLYFWVIALVQLIIVAIAYAVLK
jgi:hypothetical protein